MKKPIPFTSIRLVVFVSLAVLVLGAVMLSKTVEVYIGQLLDLSEKNEILKFLGIGFGGILLLWQAVIANKRAKAMEDTAKAQAKATEEQAKANENSERGQRQERLKNAIEHLGHDSDSVRLGGAYELFHLAKDNSELRQTVLDILCAHIRRTTGEIEYRQVPSHTERVSSFSGQRAKYRHLYYSKPSEEVQSLLTLMFVEEHEAFKRCRINLQGSWLNGAKLPRVRLQGANLVGVHLQGAELQEARLQGAHLEKAHLQGADLLMANLQGAQIKKAHLQGADLERARLHGADLVEAKLQGAHLHGAQLQGTSQMEASLQGANLILACLKGMHNDNSGMPFVEHIKYWSGKDSFVHAAIFEGGLSQKDVGFLVDGLLNRKAQNDLQEKLEPHIGKPESNELPENSGAITGAYTEEEAERWIAEYEEAM